MSSSPLPLPILIIGTGVSGLALAQGLQKASIPFRLFERDTRLNVRAQGYRVRLQGHGTAALESLLTPEHYARIKATAPELVTQGMGPLHNLDALTAEEAPTLFGGPGGGGPGPGPGPKFGTLMAGKPMNQDRTVLRNVLMQGLEDSVTFGKEFESYEITSSGVVVRFSDGSEVEGTFLVGADGGRSKVKKQFLPELKLVDTQGRIIYGKTTLTPELERVFQQKALKGMIVIHDRTQEKPLNVLLETMRFDKTLGDIGFALPQDYIYWVLIASTSRLPSLQTLHNLTPLEAAQLSKDLTSHWDPSLHPLFSFQNVDQTALMRVLSVKPDLPFWEPSNRVTLIGDAVHVMSPSSGSGATTALRDAAGLVEAFREGGVGRESVGRYEEGMRAYVRDVVTMSQVAGAKLFGMPAFEGMETVEV